MIKALSLFFVLIEFTFSSIWTVQPRSDCPASAGQLSDLGWTVQISDNENSIATKKLRYRALSPLSSPSNAAQNIYSEPYEKATKLYLASLDKGTLIDILSHFRHTFCLAQ